MDPCAESLHGEIASRPNTDIHVKEKDGDLEVMVWWHGERYYGVIKKDVECT